MNILLIGHEGYLGRSLFAYLSRTHHVLGWDKKEELFQLNGSILAREDIEILINFSVMADVQHKNFEIDTPSDEVNVMGARHIARILKGSQIAWFQFSTREVLSPIYSPDDVVKTDAGYRPRFLVDESAPYAPRNRYGKSKIIAVSVTLNPAASRSHSTWRCPAGSPRSTTVNAARRSTPSHGSSVDGTACRRSWGSRPQPRLARCPCSRLALRPAILYQ